MRTREDVGTLDDIRASAERMTGLSDYGDESFTEGFELLLQEYAASAGLTPIGNTGARAQVRGSLAARLITEAGIAANPECREVPIERPIFVIGLPRSGTTLMQRLLNADPGAQGLDAWLSDFPKPRPPRETWPDDPIFAAMQAGFEAHHAANPEFTGIHYMDATTPEECWKLLRQAGMSVAFESLAHVPAYSAWLREADWTPAYRRHREVLQLIGLNDQDQRWVLKNPSHMASLDALLAVYPDALVVHTHRDPVVAVASACSLSAEATRDWSTVFTGEVIGADQLEQLALQLEHTAAVREKADPAQFFDVAYDDFVKDPVGVVERIYGSFGLPYDDAVRAAVQEAYDASRSGAARPSHRYDLADYGLTEEQVRERFAAHPNG